MEKLLFGAESVRVVFGTVWGPKLMNRCKPDKMDTDRVWKDVKTNPHIRRRKGS